jgi:hypothetical protein
LSIPQTLKIRALILKPFALIVNALDGCLALKGEWFWRADAEAREKMKNVVLLLSF